MRVVSTPAAWKCKGSVQGAHLTGLHHRLKGLVPLCGDVRQRADRLPRRCNLVPRSLYLQMTPRMAERREQRAEHPNTQLHEAGCSSSSTDVTYACNLHKITKISDAIALSPNIWLKARHWVLSPLGVSRARWPALAVRFDVVVMGSRNLEQADKHIKVAALVKHSRGTPHMTFKIHKAHHAHSQDRLSVSLEDEFMMQLILIAPNMMFPLE